MLILDLLKIDSLEFEFNEVQVEKEENKGELQFQLYCNLSSTIGTLIPRI